MGRYGKKQNIEIAQVMELFICKYLNDDVYYKYHTAILGFISVGVETSSLLLPLSLYRRYKLHVIYLSKLGQAMELCDRIKKKQIKNFHEVRKLIDADYHMLCLLIVSTYVRTTFPEEKEALRKLINEIKWIICEIKHN